MKVSSSHEVKIYEAHNPSYDDTHGVLMKITYKDWNMQGRAKI